MPQCDPDGIGTALNLSGTSVVSITASGINEDCEDLTLNVTLSGTASSSGSAVIPTGGGSITVILAASVSVVQSMRIDLVVTP